MNSPFARVWPNFWRDFWLNGVVASILIPRRIRWRLLRSAGMRVDAADICPRVWFGNANISIGRGTFINYGCRFNTAGGISIGENCNIAMDVLFVTSTHELGQALRRAGAPISLPISVGDGAWIGARALILPGVTIASGAVIAAGAVVVSDCDVPGIWGGVPAKLLRALSDEAR